jgi:hypothetical protein
MNKDDMLDKIDEFENTINRFFRNIRTGIKNIVRWFPIIWTDRQWDFVYFLKIIKFKLEQMIRFYETEAHQIKAEKHVDKMKTCINIIDRIIDDNYHDVVFKNYYEKWGQTEIKFIKDEGTNRNRVEVIHSKVITQQDRIKSLDEYRKLTDKEEYMVKQDISLLFRLFTKHLRSWWD